MRTRIFVALLAVLGLGTARLTAQNTNANAGASAGYVVIVNESNYLTSLSAQEVARLFTKQTVRWTTGQAVTPVDLRADAPAREQFSRDVMGKSTAEVKAYWQTIIFSGRGIPPMEAPSEATVVQFVRATPGAIAYVSASTPLGDGIRVVRVRN
jgi:ABC-type phosphate transport system substrate-binding protein